MYKEFKIGGTIVTITTHDVERLYHVECRHSVIKTIAACFLGGVKRENGYKFQDEESTEHFCFLFAIAPESTWEIPF